MDEQQFIDNLLGTGEFIAEVRGSLLITDEECYRPQMAGVSLVSYPLLDDNATLAFGDDQSDMDLSATHCRIHATLRRNEDKSMDAELHPGCVVNVKRSQGQWKAYAGGVRIPLEPGMVLFDPAGARSMQVIARQVHPEWRRELEGRVESGDS